MNHMIHNLTPTPDARSTSPTTSTSSRPGRRPTRASSDLHTLWIDVEAGKVYPVFDVHKGAGGRDRRFTYPQESRAGAAARASTS